MTEVDKQTKTNVVVPEQIGLAAESTAAISALSRRRLIRGGLSAAPVMLALKSQSVLAADICIKPSAFSSLKGASMKLSHKPNSGWTCFSHGYWKNHDHPAPYSDKNKSFFLTKVLGAGETSAGFTANPGGAYTGKTLQQVLEISGNENNAALARHVVGTFLTAVSVSDDPNKVLLNQWQCRQIWDTQGEWSPVAGATWHLADWISYFEYVYGA